MLFVCVCVFLSLFINFCLINSCQYKMPQWGSGNLKAQEARMRKQLEKERKRKEEEEKKLQEFWKDDDKKVQAKINRKMENEMKRQQKLEKKKELKQLYEEEDRKYTSGKESKSTSKKISQAEILKTLIEEKKKQMEQEQKAKRIVNSDEIELEENLNHIERDEISNFDEYINVTGIDNAINALGNISFEKSKRVKAAYKKFEEENLPILKEEHKGLKLSQYKQMLWKQFKKSRENPMNHRE